MRANNILKAVLLLRKVGNKYSTKEKQIAEVNEWFAKGHMTDEQLQEWIDGLKEDLAKTPEQLEEESRQFLEELMEAEAEQLRQEMESCYEEKSYSPSCPWNAPGMSVSDFI